MKYRLALDMGTNSLGWAVWQLGEREKNRETCELDKLCDAGVRIFSDGRDPKENSLAEGRRAARGMRRRRRRLKRRKLALLYELRAQKLLPPAGVQNEIFARDPYELRHRALSEALEPYELGRALFHLGQRRGYKNNRRITKIEGEEQAEAGQAAEADQEAKTTEEKKEEQANLGRISELERLFEQSGHLSLGSFLHLRHAKGLELRFRSPQKADEQRHKKHGKRSRSIYSRDITAFYPSRKMYEDEFDAIRDAQKERQIDWERIRDILFYQRPLKQPERGKCWYYEDEPRAYSAQISSARLRVAQELLNLRCFAKDGSEISLSDGEFAGLYERLCAAKTLSFAAIKKELKKNLDFDEERGFNLERNRKELKGSPVEVDLAKDELFGKTWAKLDLEQKDDAVERMMALVFVAESRLAQEAEYFAELGLNPKQCDAVIGYALTKLPKGTQSMSAVLQRELLTRYLDEKPRDGGATILYELQQGQLKFEAASLEKLPYYGEVMPEACYAVAYKPGQSINPDEKKYGRIGNPTVHAALNQLRKVVNSLILKYGKPTEVVIELGRDLKNSKKKRTEISNAIQDNEKENKRLNEEIFKHFHVKHPGRDMRRKLKLFKELSKGNQCTLCPYCGQNMNMSDLFSDSNIVEIEHILPYSRTLDSSMANLTVSHASCNREKGNRSPYEAFASDGARWQKIEGVITGLKENKQRRFEANAMKHWEEDNAFLARQLTDNAYIARKSMHYLKLLAPQVWANNGQVTALLRDSWGLDSLLYSREEQMQDNNPEEQMQDNDPEEQKQDKSPEDKEGKKRKGKNREDHRHHALDAIVIGMVDRGMLQKITRAHTRNQQSGYELHREAMKGVAKVRPNLRKEIKPVLEKICVSHRPDHNTNSRFFKETAYGKMMKAVPLEKAQDWLNELPILASRGQAEFLLDYLADHAPALKKAEKNEARAQVLEHLRQLAATVRKLPEAPEAWPELLAVTKKLYKAPLLKEAAEAYTLEFPEKELRCWREFFVTSKALTALKEDDCKPLKEHRHGPVDEGLRQRLGQAWQEYCQNYSPTENQKAEKPKWENFATEYGQQHGIRSVRYIPKNQTMVPLPSQAHIYYAYDGFAFCEVWSVPKKDKVGGWSYTYTGKFVSYYEAHNGHSSERPHPAAKRIAKLYKNDVLYSESEEQYYLVKGYSTTRNLIDIRLLSDAKKSENQKAINIIFGEKTMRCVPVRLDALGEEIAQRR